MKRYGRFFRIMSREVFKSYPYNGKHPIFRQIRPMSLAAGTGHY